MPRLGCLRATSSLFAEVAEGVFFPLLASDRRLACAPRLRRYSLGDVDEGLRALSTSLLIAGVVEGVFSPRDGPLLASDERLACALCLRCNFLGCVDEALQALSTAGDGVVSLSRAQYCLGSLPRCSSVFKVDDGVGG